MKKVQLNRWQRLWVLLIVLDLLLIAAAAWYRWPTFENSNNYTLYYNSLPPIMRAELVRPGSKEDKDEFIKFYGEMRNGDRLRFKKSLTREEADNIAREYATIVEDQVHKEREWLIASAGLVLLGSSFALYAFGWAVAWVYRALRPTSKGGR